MNLLTLFLLLSCQCLLVSCQDDHRQQQRNLRHHQGYETTATATKKKKSTVHVYILAGQSNMEGHGQINYTDHKTKKQLNGTLLYQLTDPRTKDEFEPLWDSKHRRWNNFSNVKVWFNEVPGHGGVNGSKIPGTNGVDYSAGDLTVGYGAGGLGGKYFGLELGLGMQLLQSAPAVGSNGGDKVLIVKTAWGGKSLVHDFRPPSSASKSFVDPYCLLPDCNPHKIGHFYKTMLDDVEKLLRPGVIGTIYPDLKDFTPDIAGFGWFQGWNDGCNVNATAAYETNLVHLISDIRQAWKKPHLPVAIATSGFLGWATNVTNRNPPDCWDGPNATKVDCHCGRKDRHCSRINIIVSQIEASNLTKHPELECCVEAVETRDYWREREFSPSGQVYHFWHNAESHYLIGKALAGGFQRAQQQQQEWQQKQQLQQQLQQEKKEEDLLGLKSTSISTV